MKLFYSVMFVLIGLVSTNSFSQEDSIQDVKKYYLIVKNDGGEFYGYILKDDGREILLETKNIGKIYINKSDIKMMRIVEETAADKNNSSLEYGDLREQGPFTTRYYFTTNALPIKKKENYALIHLYGPEVHFAVTDNLSVGIMASWIASPIALALKYSFKNSNPDSDVHFAIGSIVGSGGYLAPNAFGGLHFATLTKGDRVANVSLSAGFAHLNTGTLFGSGSYSKYSYQGYNPSDNFYVPDDFRHPDYNSTYANYRNERITKENNNGSLVIGISGIKNVGKKASFIFDSMIFLTKKTKVEYNSYESLPFTKTETTWDYSTNPSTSTTVITNQSFNVGVGKLVDDGFKPTIILMPGMRFNRDYGSAIQVVLSGVIYEKSNGSFGGFPVPMVSWLKGF